MSRPAALAVCAAPVLGLFAVAALAPLPYILASPGLTTDVLGAKDGKPVITVTGAPTRETSGHLRMTTILATGPSSTVSLPELVDNWFRTDRAVMPKEAVYPTGGSDKEITAHNMEEMTKSQSAAAQAALGFLHKSPDTVKVELSLADVGGPSAGLLFSSASSTSSTVTGRAATSPAAGTSPVRAPSPRTARSARSVAWH